MKMLRSLLLGGMLGFTVAGRSWAVDPFDNWVNPEGAYLVLYPVHVNAQEKTDNNGEKNPLFNNADLHATQLVFRGVYYGPNWLLSVYLPYGRTDLRNPVTGKLGHDVGVGDPTLVGGWFFVNDKKANTYAALGLKVDLPWGEYDKTRVANQGNNVIRYRPLLAFAMLRGPVDFEATLTYDMRRANKDFFTGFGGGSYDPGEQFSLETYAGMFLSPRVMPGLHLNGVRGKDDRWDSGAGRQTVANSAVKNLQAGASVLFLPHPKFNVMFQVIRDLAPKNAFKGTLFLSRLAYKF